MQQKRHNCYSVSGISFQFVEFISDDCSVGDHLITALLKIPLSPIYCGAAAHSHATAPSPLVVFGRRQSVPLSEAELAEIEQLAIELEVPTADLMREWVLRNLSEERLISLQRALERLEEKVDQLTKRLDPLNRYEQFDTPTSLSSSPSDPENQPMLTDAHGNVPQTPSSDVTIDKDLIAFVFAQAAAKKPITGSLIGEFLGVSDRTGRRRLKKLHEKIPMAFTSPATTNKAGI